VKGSTAEAGPAQRAVPSCRTANHSEQRWGRGSRARWNRHLHQCRRLRAGASYGKCRRRRN